MPIKLRLTTSCQQKYDAQLRTATASDMDLARIFQRLAFADRAFDPQCIPAPLYLDQAMVCKQRPDLRQSLIDMLSLLPNR